MRRTEIKVLPYCKRCGINWRFGLSKYCRKCKTEIEKERLKKHKVKEREKIRKEKKRERKHASPSYLKKQLDRLWATEGKFKARCEVCETLPLHERINYKQIHPHHYVGRKNLRLRWDFKNRVWLCPIHHDFGFPSAHQDPAWFEEWMQKYRKEDWEYCNRVKNEIQTNIDYRALLNQLSEEKTS